MPTTDTARHASPVEADAWTDDLRDQQARSACASGIFARAGYALLAPGITSGGTDDRRDQQARSACASGIFARAGIRESADPGPAQ